MHNPEPFYHVPPKSIIDRLLTHGIEVVKYLMHADDLIVEFIIAARVWQEGVAIRDEQVENVYHLTRCGKEKQLQLKSISFRK